MIDWAAVDREVSVAHDRTHGKLTTTELRQSQWASDRAQRPILLKLENEQISGSFKYRGAVNKVIACVERGTARLYTASTGNHALAVAAAGKLLGVECCVLLPSSPDPSVIASMLREAGATVDVVAGDVLDAERNARELGDQESGAEFASPYNDVEVVAGHSTLGREIGEQLGGGPSRYWIVCSTGGGGLAAGLKLGTRLVGSNGRVHAASPAASPVLVRAIRRGYIIEEHVEPTICYGTAGNIDLDSITLPLCAELVDGWSEVDEPAIAHALEGVREQDEIEIDGSAATACAAAVALAAAIEPSVPIVALVCGTDRKQ